MHTKDFTSVMSEHSKVSKRRLEMVRFERSSFFFFQPALLKVDLYNLIFSLVPWLYLLQLHEKVFCLNYVFNFLMFLEIRFFGSLIDAKTHFSVARAFGCDNLFDHKKEEKNHQSSF